jgi:hypothetical protein
MQEPLLTVGCLFLIRSPVPGFVYELLFSPEQFAQSAFSVVIPLIATVGINDKVTSLEKWGTG